MLLLPNCYSSERMVELQLLTDSSNVGVIILKTQSTLIQLEVLPANLISTGKITCARIHSSQVISYLFSSVKVNQSTTNTRLNAIQQ